MKTMRVTALNNPNFAIVCGAFLMVAASVGCGKPPDDTSTAASTTTPTITYKFDSEAGVPLPPSTVDPKKTLDNLYVETAEKYGPARQDPFALTKDETSYETSQTSLRAFDQIGGFSSDYPIEQPKTVQQEVVEPQPYRRLAGIVISDSVLGIIEMGEGREPIIIQPGERIPNSEWTVVSIDDEKAVLRRDGNVIPKEITVRLESPPPGQSPAGVTGGGFPGGPGAGGGFPGGGVPGGRGGRFGGGPGRGGQGGFGRGGGGGGKND